MNDISNVKRASSPSRPLPPSGCIYGSIVIKCKHPLFTQMATTQPAEEHQIAPCVICAIPCNEIEGRRPMCSNCAADMKRRKERVIDRVRHSTPVETGPQKDGTMSYESQKGRLESDNRKSRDKEAMNLKRAKSKKGSKPGFWGRFLQGLR
ncbi:hypothetical protein BKA67DRAFT_540542 [Truncatella angustata]|uniref:Uncharacterized protein n=1 Tax=Truncatella angustata TaxID=152316 RepID=A0A9P8RMT2_9PEZI|nr:uncharacterized protein BKA67DRAFT_540542 [Truncatella angustata]KAH6647083.1 hypothetical protein BKA67DRAFT_540542 [Truncatella angustata]